MTAPPSAATPVRGFLAHWRQLQQEPGDLRPLPIGLTASYTIEPLVPYLGCFLAQRGLLGRFTIAPFNQIYQSLLDPAGLCAHAPRITVVLPRLEDLCQQALDQLAGLDPADVAAGRSAAEGEGDRLCAALEHYQAAQDGLLLCGTLPPAASLPLGVLDPSHEASQEALRAALNQQLWRFVTGQRAARVRLFDQAGVVTAIGTRAAYDDRMWHLSRCPFSDALLRALAERLARTIAPLLVAPAKVVAVDLDHTLWGGVIGEDGLSGIVLGDSGAGGAYQAFQEALLQLRAQGVLLCVCSKNNEADAWEVFDRHPGMRLRRSHLSGARICWGGKAESLRALSAELSLGLDSFVFIDDSPTECAEVRLLLPQVTVVQLPADPAHYVAALRDVPTLDRMVLTAEDRRRATQYEQERQRQKALQGQADLADPEALLVHLRSLELRVRVRRLGPADAGLPRVAQLTQKTNQFNLTTRRRTEAEVAALLRDPAWLLYAMDVADRFGDYGTTGLVFAARDPGDQAAYHLDTLLLSCRVLGRAVETALLSAVAADLHRAGGLRLSGEFLPTAKNAPAASFLQDHGFRPQRGRLWLEPLGEALFAGSIAHLALSAMAKE